MLPSEGPDNVSNSSAQENETGLNGPPDMQPDRPHETDRDREILTQLQDILYRQRFGDHQPVAIEPPPASGFGQCHCTHLPVCTGRSMSGWASRRERVSVGRLRPCGCFHRPNCPMVLTNFQDSPFHHPPLHHPVPRGPILPSWLLDELVTQPSNPGVVSTARAMLAVEPETERGVPTSQPAGESVQRESNITPRPSDTVRAAQTSSQPPVIQEQPRRHRLRRGWNPLRELERLERMHGVWEG